MVHELGVLMISREVIAGWDWDVVQAWAVRARERAEDVSLSGPLREAIVEFADRLSADLARRALEGEES